jgi:uncharacterized protein (TIRG00374 family)
MMKGHVLLGTAFSIGLVAWLLYQVDIQQLALTLQSAHYSYMILATGAILSTYVVRSWRWQYILQPVKPVALTSLISATGIGFMVNMLLPARAGELARAYVIGHKEQMSTVASLASIVVERVVDLASLLLLIIPVLGLSSLSPHHTAITSSLRTAGLFVVLVCLGAIAILWHLTSKPRTAMTWLAVGLRLVPRKWRQTAREGLQSFSSALQALRSSQHVAPITLLSLAIWGLQALSNWLIFLSFDLQLPTLSAFFILFVQTVGVMIPSSPGFIGTYHASVIAGLGYFGVAQDLALSVAISMHAVFFFPCIGVGFIFLWSESLSLHQLRTSVRHAAAGQTALRQTDRVIDQRASVLSSASLPDANRQGEG